MMILLSNDGSGQMYFLPGQSDKLLKLWQEYAETAATASIDPGAWAGLVNPGGEELARFASWLETKKNPVPMQLTGGSGKIISFRYSAEQPLALTNFEALMEVRD